MKKSIIYSLALSSLLFASCSDDEGGNNPNISTPAGSTYILTQGNFYNNIEGGLDVIDYKTGISTSVFKTVNRRSLGDTPQCGVACKGNIYIGVAESNTIEILDAETYTSKKQIRLSQTRGYGSTPRSMVASGDYVYVSMFSGHVARLNVNTQEFDGVVAVGPNPDIMALYNGKLYVPITNGMDYPNYDNRVQIIDPASMQVEQSITVGINPTEMIAADGHLYVLATGNYDKTLPNYQPSQLREIMPDNSVNFICEATIVEACGQGVLIIDQQFDENGIPTAQYLKYNPASKQTEVWNVADKPDYPNYIYYDKTADKVLIASYVMSGVYPSYDLPGYVNAYTASDMKLAEKYNLGTAGPCYIFKMQK